MTVLERLARAPMSAVELANVLLTTGEAVVGATPREVVWTHRDTTLYRYQSEERLHAVPILLVFALINRPDIFDLRPGSSLVAYLLSEGFDVFLVDWGTADEEDADRGLDDFVCDELDWAIRETLRASGQDELTLMGWCMGATMCAMYCGLPADGRAGAAAVRNLVLLTMPVDGRTSTFAQWLGGDDFDPERIAGPWRVLPGAAIDFANKLLKPLTNFFTGYRRLAWSVVDGTIRRRSTRRPRSRTVPVTSAPSW